jgi:hypothetical protein
LRRVEVAAAVVVAAVAAATPVGHLREWVSIVV